jgi:hypothetical protein
MVKMIALLVSLLLVGCTISEAQKMGSGAEPTTTDSTILVGNAVAKKPAVTSCMHPAGWRTYTVSEYDTPDLLAARYNISLQNLMVGNCLTDPATMVTGRAIYVPYIESAPALQTILPLGISFLNAEPAVVDPGAPVTITWQSQGIAASIRLGSVFEGQFFEETRGLPQTGTVQITAPADGRDSLTFMLLVSDGGKEIAAQTTIRMSCTEKWFFAPAPLECPSPPLLTNFQEQHFEHGTIVYIAALDLHYVMIVGQEAIAIEHAYRPGVFQADYNVPAGYSPTRETMNAVWNREDIRNALGYAIGERAEYPGLLQRSGNNVIHFLASSGHIYRVGQGLVWGVIVPE